MSRIRSSLALMSLVILLVGSTAAPAQASSGPADDVAQGKNLALAPGGPDEIPAGAPAGIAVLAAPTVGPVTPNAGCSDHGVEQVFTTTFSLSMVVAPLAGTAVYQRLGPHVLWYGVGLTGVLLFALCSALAPVFRRERRIAA